jgi:predicted nuclease of predicted toxin-antitoxin system
VKIVADENVDKEIVDRLRADGHEVAFIAEDNPGTDDQTVLNRSVKIDGVLLTADKDFGDLVFRQRLSHSGVLLIRLAGVTPDMKAALVAATFDRHEEELRSGFAVLTKRSLRFRKIDPAAF